MLNSQQHCKKQQYFTIVNSNSNLIQNKIHFIPTYQIIKNKGDKMSTITRHQNSKSSLRHPSVTDSQQQLRVLIMLVDQYNNQFLQILEQNKDTIEESPNFQIFIETLKVKGEAEIKILYNGLKSFKRILQQVLGKSLHILPDVMKQLQTSRGRMLNFQEQIDDKDLIIQGLKQKRNQIQKNLTEINMLYEKSRHDNLQLSKQISYKQQQFETQSRQIRKTFMQVTQSSEMEKRILQQMYESNEKLAASLTQTKNEKKIIEKQLQKISEQLTKNNNKIINLEIQLQKRENKIRQYQNQIQSIHNSRRKKSSHSMASFNNQQQEQPDYRQSFNQQFQQKKSDSKTKLNQQLQNYKMPTVKQLNGSFIMGSAIRRSIGQESDYASEYQEPQKINRSMIQQKQPQKQQQIIQPKMKKNKKQVTDPYFSHYILISQSVKINQDCQDMLSIDMKPYYQQIIEKRIPMHLWDQWIRNRLRELFKQNYRKQ